MSLALQELGQDLNSILLTCLLSERPVGTTAGECREHEHRAWGRVPYITSTSLPFFDRSGSVHEARSKQQGRRLPDRSFEIPTSTRRSRV